MTSKTRARLIAGCGLDELLTSLRREATAEAEGTAVEGGGLDLNLDVSGVPMRPMACPYLAPVEGRRRLVGSFSRDEYIIHSSLACWTLKVRMSCG